MVSSLEKRERFSELKKIIAETLQSGYALTTTDLGDFLQENGFSRNSVSNVTSEIKTGFFERITGMQPAVTKCKGRIIIFDGTLDSTDTDLEAVRERIEHLRSNFYWKERI